MNKIDISVLKPLEQYDKYSSASDNKNLKDSIESQGILTNILVSPDMTIIDGHKRVQVAKELGIKMIPISVCYEITTEQDKLKLFLASNLGKSKNIDMDYKKFFLSKEDKTENRSVGRPKLEESKKKKQMVLTLSPKTYDTLINWAASKPRSAPNYISDFIEDHLDEILNGKK